MVKTRTFFYYDCKFGGNLKHDPNTEVIKVEFRDGRYMFNYLSYSYISTLLSEIEASLAHLFESVKLYHIAVEYGQMVDRVIK